MATTVVRTCDQCGSGKDVALYRVLTGDRTMDASGNGYDDECKDVDLCKECAEAHLAVAFGYAEADPASLAKLFGKPPAQAPCPSTRWSKGRGGAVCRG